MKIRINVLAKELNLSVADLLVLVSDKLRREQYAGRGGNTWITEDGADALRLARVAPLAVPTRLIGFVIQEARNPSWVYCAFPGVDGKHPVAIPRQLRGKLHGKYIQVDAITDAGGGTTYRHERLGLVT